MRFLTRVAPVLALLLIVPLGESSAQSAPAFLGPQPSAGRAPASLYQHFAARRQKRRGILKRLRSQGRFRITHDAFGRHGTG